MISSSRDRGLPSTNPDVSRISVGDLFVQRTAVAKDDKEDRQAGRREGLRYYSLNICIQPAVYIFVLFALAAYYCLSKQNVLLNKSVRL